MFTVYIMIVAIIYSNYWSLSRRIKPELIFWVSIVSSYVVSLLVWIFTGQPSTGTSIIGFCMVGFLFLRSLNDLRFYFNKERIEDNKSTIRNISLTASLAFISLVFALLFYSLNQSVYVHFAGGAICATLIIIIVKLKN